MLGPMPLWKVGRRSDYRANPYAGSVLDLNAPVAEQGVSGSARNPGPLENYPTRADVLWMGACDGY